MGSESSALGQLWFQPAVRDQTHPRVLFPLGVSTCAWCSRGSKGSAPGPPPALERGNGGQCSHLEGSSGRHLHTAPRLFSLSPFCFLGPPHKLPAPSSCLRLPVIPHAIELWSGYRAKPNNRKWQSQRSLDLGAGWDFGSPSPQEHVVESGTQPSVYLG